MTTTEVKRTGGPAGSRLFIAVPSYWGNVSAATARSLMQLAALCAGRGVRQEAHFLSNSGLPVFARNYLAHQFMQSSCTHLMFIDADVGFVAADVLTLLDLAGGSSPCDIVGAAYPNKEIRWSWVREAVEASVNDGELIHFAGSYSFEQLPGQAMSTDVPMQVAGLGTGFMMIRRETFEMFDRAYPHLTFWPSFVAAPEGEMRMYFHAGHDPDSRQAVTEDYWFCRKVRAAGGRIWVCPWMRLARGM